MSSGIEQEEGLSDSVPREAVLLCREGRVCWASEGAGAVLACGSPLTLEGRRFTDYLLDTGDGLPSADGEPRRCSARFSDGAPVDLLARRMSAGGDELWFISEGTLPAVRESLVTLFTEARSEVAGLREKLKQRDEERDDFLALLGHELRTPITVIGGYGRLLLSDEEGSLSETQRRYLSQALKSCKHLDSLVESFLDISSGEGFDAVISPAAGSVRSVITDACESLAPLFSAREIEVEILMEDVAESAVFDAIRIRQVLSNLLENAIRFSKRGGKVRIGSRPSKSPGYPSIEIFVTDEGCGIDEDQLERIFEPYVRSIRGENRSGHGLGLAISRRIVTAHRGDIWAANEPGGGARFAFTLPLDCCEKQENEEKIGHE